MLLILDQLRIIPTGKWLERHLDILSIQSAFMRARVVEGRAVTLRERLFNYKRFMGRVGS